MFDSYLLFSMSYSFIFCSIMSLNFCSYVCHVFYDHCLCRGCNSSSWIFECTLWLLHWNFQLQFLVAFSLWIANVLKLYVSFDYGIAQQGTLIKITLLFSIFINSGFSHYTGTIYKLRVVSFCFLCFFRCTKSGRPLTPSTCIINHSIYLLFN